MTKNIILDLGEVLVPLKINRARLAFFFLGLLNRPKKLKEAFLAHEKGHISLDEFISILKIYAPLGSKKRLIKIWNSIIGEFRQENFDVLNWAKKSQYQLFLLSNISESHLKSVQEKMGEKKYEFFKGFFNKMYLSYEIGLRKPQKEIYELVLKENNIKAQETIFVDDLKENILSAKSLGFQTWLFDPKKDSIKDLKINLLNLN